MRFMIVQQQTSGQVNHRNSISGLPRTDWSSNIKKSVESWEETDRDHYLFDGPCLIFVDRKQRRSNFGRWGRGELKWQIIIRRGVYQNYSTDHRWNSNCRRNAFQHVFSRRWCLIRLCNLLKTNSISSVWGEEEQNSLNDEFISSITR